MTPNELKLVPIGVISQLAGARAHWMHFSIEPKLTLVRFPISISSIDIHKPKALLKTALLEIFYSSREA